MPDTPPSATSEWTIGRLLDWTRKHFESRGIDDARLCAELLLARALHCQKILLYARINDVPTEEQRSVFRDLVKRAADHAPIAYLIGHKEFYSLDFNVTPAVLIPRPETELVVERALAWCKSRSSPISQVRREAATGMDAPPEPQAAEVRAVPQAQSTGAIAAQSLPREGVDAPPREGPARIDLLDVGTGSGCIAITIAKRNSAVFAVATDISEDALAVARQNAERHGVADRVRFFHADLLDLPAGAVPGTACADDATSTSGSFDLIVSNPPYVADSDRETLPPNVRDHEPHAALFAGSDGLAIYRRMAAGMSRADGLPLLKPGGALIIEIGEGQADAVGDIFAAAGLVPVARHRDLAGAERVLEFRRT